MTPNFSLGQHFMTDEKVVDKIISHIPSDKIVLEIGPGMGALSQRLSNKSKKLILVEKDKKFEKYLIDFDVIFENVLTTKLPRFDILVSNLAFNIIEPLFMILIRKDFEEIYLTISAGTYKKLLTNRTKFPYVFHKFFQIKKLEDISRHSFQPKPRVDAVFVKLTPIKEQTLFKTLVRMHDQKLKNAIIETLKSKKTKNESRKAYSTQSISALNKRVRNLTLKELKDVEAMLNEEERNIR